MSNRTLINTAQVTKILLKIQVRKLTAKIYPGTE